MFASDAWRLLATHALADEQALAGELGHQLDHHPALLQATSDQAGRWIAAIRDEPPPQGIQALLRHFPLGSSEATALMRLAEALPRISDAEVANALLRDLLGPIDWHAAELGNYRQREPAATRLLAIASRWVRRREAAARFGRLATTVGDPLLRRAFRYGVSQLAQTYVFAEEISAAIRTAHSRGHAGDAFSFDLLGEGALCQQESLRYRQNYETALAALAAADWSQTSRAPSLSIKLSAVDARFDPSHATRLQAELVPWLAQLVMRASAAGIGITIDAEEADRFELSLTLLERTYAALPVDARPHLGIALQAYSKRAWYALPWLHAVAEHYAVRLPIRLVKGAYWDTEIKRAQQRGLADYPVFTSKRNTDIAYLACGRWLLAHSDRLFPQFATHNAVAVAALLQAAEAAGVSQERFEFQRLHGMGEELYRVVRRQFPGLQLRVYAPVGAQRELLPYLVRRLLENGANSSFVTQLHNPKVSVADLARHPLHGHLPSETLLLPAQIFLPLRPNSRGVWLASEHHRAAFLHELNAYRGDWRGDRDAADAFTVTSPVDGDTVGRWRPLAATEIPSLLAAARVGFHHWMGVSVAERQAILDRVADRLENHRAELVAMVARETGKPLADALEEIREAADFCRYYGREAMRLMQEHALPGPTGEANTLRYRPRGTFLCISPWNFPVAIFTGQIAAALATGNGVIAKPAEQATLCAELTTRLFHEAGVPTETLQLATGDGERIGTLLCGERDIAGIAFTGGSATARTINQRLAAREGPIIPLIAETGGINALIADGSAYPPQLVADVIRSAFDSAGQRCSALRLLFLPDSIAPEVETLLSGAVRELRLGDPLDWSTDMGPVIDGEAHQRLLRYIEHWRQRGRLLAAGRAPTTGLFVAPTVIRLERPDELQEEWFGPILHVVRYRHVATAIDWVNGSGFGLTVGIHSRNEPQALQWAERLKVGNCYINRDMIGAVVGSQPFGGEGRSGTGFKAGGPNYLLRFLHERTLTVNTAAWGGDLRLLGTPPR